MTHPRILVLADDLTGALEAGSKFAAAGVKSRVKTAEALSPRDLQDVCGVLVVDSETRHLSSSEAYQRVYDLARAARTEGFPMVYKKTDSTLRGNIGAELAALIEAYGGSPLLYVPAYPQMGRTVRNGALEVDGVPVGGTCFATDPLNPVTESHIPTLLAAQCARRVRSGSLAEIINAEPYSIAVCDGETDADVEAAARAFINSATFRLAAGPAALATHLARLANLPRALPAPPAAGKQALIVNGSLHPVSLQQVEQARRDGFASIAGPANSNGTADTGWLILEPNASAGAASLDFCRQLAHSVRDLLERRPIDLLVVFGGDTAHAIVEALGSPTLHSLGEVMEGIPVSRIAATDLDAHAGPRVHDLYVVTKAGGFGPPGVVAAIRNLLNER